MTERKWTDGPWVWHEHGMLQSPKTGRPIEVSGLGLAHFAKNTGGVEAESNAHLIAAAPDLYEALENLLYAMKLEHPHTTFPEAHKALAKARGEA